MSPQFRIYDWAGNLPFGEKTFCSFEDAWNYLLAFFPDEEDEEFFAEYYVE